jgi:hypothetical protein
MKLREHLINLKNRVFKHTTPQETIHSYDLQARTSPATNETVNPTDANPTLTKIPPIHKISNVIVPRSKRVLSLDAFRGFGKRIKLNQKKISCIFSFSFNCNDIY